MKKPSLFIFLLPYLMLSQFASYQNGNLSDECTWNPSCNAGTPGRFDDVNIYHDVVLNRAVSVNQTTWTIHPGAELSSASNYTDGINIRGSRSQSGNLIINEKAEINGPLTLYSNANMELLNGDTLIVSGNVSLTNNSSLYIASNSVFIVNGNVYNFYNSTDVNIYGKWMINGLLYGGYRSNISGNGSVEADSVYMFPYGRQGTVFGNSGISCGNTLADGYYCQVQNSGVTFLPVELTHFQANWLDNQVGITWSTATEMNNELFFLEISNNGRDFTLIHEEPGANFSSHPLNYQYFYTPIEEGLVYFRLSQMDYNGDKEVLDIIPFTIPTASPTYLITFPNPITQNQVHLKSSQFSSDETYAVEFINLQGQVIHRANYVCNSPQLLCIHIPPNLVEGYYLLKSEDQFCRILIK